MKLFWSPSSPAARKAMICAIELGVDDRIETLPSAPHPVNRDAAVVEVNPLGQIPVLVTDDGAVLHDSRVICEYLDALVDGAALFPRAGPRRWTALTLQSTADGVLTAAINARYERAVRPAERQWPEWRAGQLEKVTAALDQWEAGDVDEDDPFDIGTISMACALGYLDLRFAEIDWRTAHPRLGRWFESVSRRPSMQATFPAA